jgi:Raf kinase inhibitor-like YbhB/YbcL family protein
MQFNSPEFGNNEMIPSKFTCDGQDINPPLKISEIPPNTKSLALTVKDPDAPSKTWIHWVVYDIPVINEIKENSVPGRQGANDFGKKEYGGPCPPSGKHHYFFDIYALDSNLDLEDGKDVNEVEKAMEGHILDKAQLVGLYKR